MTFDICHLGHLGHLGHLEKRNKRQTSFSAYPASTTQQSTIPPSSISTARIDQSSPWLPRDAAHVHLFFFIDCCYLWETLYPTLTLSGPMLGLVSRNSKQHISNHQIGYNPKTCAHMPRPLVQRVTTSFCLALILNPSGSLLEPTPLRGAEGSRRFEWCFWWSLGYNHVSPCPGRGSKKIIHEPPNRRVFPAAQADSLCNITHATTKPEPAC